MFDGSDFRLLNENASLFRDYKEYLKFTQLYDAAIKQLTTKFEILSSECETYDSHNPIHHIDSRLKSTKSIIEKLRKRGFEVSVESAMQNLNDIAGLRVVCSYIDDVYRVSDMLLRQSDVVLLVCKDYIKEPNFNGYRSLHLIVTVPIFLAHEKKQMKVEVQLRTIAMDVWASLEHQLRYKKSFEYTKEMADELLYCANLSAELDRRMDKLRDLVQQTNE